LAQVVTTPPASTRWAYFYDRDGKLLLVCPPADTKRWWDAQCILRLEVRDVVAVCT
jgi:hypothetical protein